MQWPEKVFVDALYDLLKDGKPIRDVRDVGRAVLKACFDSGTKLVLDVIEEGDEKGGTHVTDSMLSSQKLCCCAENMPHDESTG